jgi:hypothetical protein
MPKAVFSSKIGVTNIQNEEAMEIEVDKPEKK